MAVPPPKRPNMQHIADAAGVSKSAVSLALRKDPRIPEVTRKRIAKIAEDLGYRRNPVIDSLMTQLRAGHQPNFRANLGLVNCSPEKDICKNHTFRRLREGVLRRSEQLGYGVEEFWLQQPDLRPQRLKQILLARGIHGLILIASLDQKTIHQHDYSDFWNDFACAVIGVTHFNDNLNCASNDQYLTARRATQMVLEYGYKRPLLVVPTQDDKLLDDKFSAGFLSVVRFLSPENFLMPVNYRDENLPETIAAIQQHEPDVIITNKTELYDVMLDTGVSFPTDMGLVHLDWHDGIPHIAGMRQNNRVVGSAGVDLVAGQLYKNEFGPQKYPQVVQIESAWIHGPSVRKIR
ncbi:LacI family DNA-binding transcriptional regulator [Cerasicoccus arenae]|uniref:HTH lacI-type domain-containing protein n=1 Tax=Cerasicoccus arenae TaxID=424488 RepID=A0A8J3GEM9_9BACT|nr:LacI family DNA-binding transcriptional regulator [Cerasicoccus arenae]MBK1857206.1 LacI family DNA-binding transcriptional regulator [Cerasicoccus arenae]GHB99988.1 hypothetical protein GCM10007047_15260 [Cerasicoccus arenae]